MGADVKTVGGGPATGLANDFVQFLQQALQSGQFGGYSSPAPAPKPGYGQFLGGKYFPAPQPSAAQRFNQADPVASTTGIAGVLNDILAGGAGKLGGSLNELITKDTERQVADARARFGAAGGTAFGTPAAYAESLIKSEQGPKLATAIGGLQLQTVLPLLQLIAALSGKGIPQASTIVQPNPIVSAISTIAQGAGAIAPFFVNPFGGGSRGVSSAPTIQNFDPYSEGV